MKYQNHPLADLFPMMQDPDLAELASDIKQNGIRAKITLLDGKILDGRNRYAACMKVGAVPIFREHKAGDPLAFVLSQNLHRRHLSASQRAMIAAEIVNIKNGGDRITDQSANLQTGAVTRAAAAKQLHVSERAVNAATKIISESPRQAAAIRDGEKTIHKVTEEEKAKVAAKSAPQSKDKKPDALDGECRPIPHKLLDLWNRAEDEGKVALNILSKMRSAMRDAREEKDPVYGEINFSSLLPELDNAYSELKKVAPHAICHTCQGLRPEKCSTCKGRGFVSKFFWDRCVPEEFKAILSKKK